MRSLIKKLAIAGVVIGIAWQFAFPQWTIRYRLTLVAEVDGREVSGSGVIETRWRSQGPLSRLTGRPWSTSVRGEAVVVDLGDRGMFFALLRGDSDRKGSRDPEHLLSRAFAQRSIGSTNSVMLHSMVPSRQPVMLDLSFLPMLVRFRDLADPKSVEKVDPTNLAASFGQDVRLSRAMIEIVPAGWLVFDWIGWPETWSGEPLTSGIEMKLPWLSSLYNKLLDGRTYEDFTLPNRLPNSLGPGAFKAGG